MSETRIFTNLKIPTVKEEISRYAKKYKDRTVTHPNQLAAEASKTFIEKILKGKHPIDLTKEIKQSNSKMVFRWG